MAEWVDWDGKLTPAELIEHLRVDKICPECGGLGSFPEQIDDDRFPTMVVCHRCRMFCQVCTMFVPKTGHPCHKPGT